MQAVPGQVQAVQIPPGQMQIGQPSAVAQQMPPGVQQQSQNIPQTPQQQSQSQTVQPQQDDAPNQIFTTHQFNMLRLQINSYKSILKNEPVPQKLLEVLKAKPPAPLNAAQQQQQQQASILTSQPQQIRMGI